MKKIIVLLCVFAILFAGCGVTEEKDQKTSETASGGTIQEIRTENGMVQVPGTDFWIGEYEVTQKEWKNIMGNNPSEHKSDRNPVENVSWYHCIEYCNKKSEKEGLQPYYTILSSKKDSANKNEYDTVKWVVQINSSSNGYRLPTEKEWELAASGGSQSKKFSYSGANDADEVAWTWQNSGIKKLSGNWNWDAISGNKSTTHEVGKKKPNEIGLYDMSGNVREWCYDWYEGADFQKGYYRICKGGGWMGDDSCCKISYKGKFEANGIGSDQGFRICRNA